MTQNSGTIVIMVKKYFTIAVGKSFKKVAALRGGGSALPGLVVEKIDPDFLRHILSTLPMGVVIISGTNGKTTTTKIVTELLEANGVKVFTNRTGSNFPRGVAAALLGEIDMRGKLNADIAVLELDEAWAVRFIEKVQPRYSLLLNVMRDQLDRFAEIDKTAKLLEKVALATTDSVVINQDDFRLQAIAAKLTAKTVFYGMSEQTKHLIASSDQIDSIQEEDTPHQNSVLLKDFTDNEVHFTIGEKTYTTSPSLKGVYNLQNAAAALSLTKEILETNDIQYSDGALVETLGTIQPAFGRGETVSVNGTPVTLLLVKNPKGFQLALNLAGDRDSVMIAINDNFADGRDMSWLWDVDFSRLKTVTVTSGVRAYDMALRLGYDNIATSSIEPELEKALHTLLATNPKQPKLIYCTYTAMLSIRKILSTKTELEHIS